MIMRMHIFQNFVLDNEEFISGMSFVSFYNDLEQYHDKIILFCGKIFTSLPLDFRNSTVA